MSTFSKRAAGAQNADSRGARLVAAVLPAALLAAVLLLSACGSDSGDARQTEAGYAIGDSISDSTIAAIVEAGDFSDTLSYDRLQREMNQLARGRLAMFPDSIRQQVQRAALMRFVRFTAQIAEAQERGLNADSAAAVEQRVENIRAQAGGDSVLQARLEQSGMTMAEVRADIRNQLQVLGLQQALAEEIEEPTAEEVSEYRTDQAREVRVERIFFEVPAPAQRDSVRQRARAALDSIQSGAADFSAMAQRYGQGPGSTATYQSRQAMAAPFAQPNQPPETVPFVETAFALSDSGAVAEEPVRAGSGFYLLRQAGSRTGALMDSARAAQQFRQQQQREALRDAIEELLANATVRLNPSRITADMTQPLPNQGDEDESGG